MTIHHDNESEQANIKPAPLQSRAKNQLTLVSLAALEVIFRDQFFFFIHV